MRKADQDESSLGQPPQSGEHKGRGRGKKGGKGQCSYRNGDRRGLQQNYQASWQQPYQHQHGRSRTPHRQQVGRQSPASRHQEWRQNSAYRQQDHPPGMNARVQNVRDRTKIINGADRAVPLQMQKPEQVVIGRRPSKNAPQQDTGCKVASTACAPMGQPKLARVRKSSSQPGHGTWR